MVAERLFLGGWTAFSLINFSVLALLLSLFSFVCVMLCYVVGLWRFLCFVYGALCSYFAFGARFFAITSGLCGVTVLRLLLGCMVVSPYSRIVWIDDRVSGFVFFFKKKFNEVSIAVSELLLGVAYINPLSSLGGRFVWPMTMKRTMGSRKFAWVRRHGEMSVRLDCGSGVAWMCLISEVANFYLRS